MYRQFDIQYDTFELVPAWSIFCYYINSALITFWMILKWFGIFLWNSISQYTYNSAKNYETEYRLERRQNNPPQCLVGTELGIQSYVKLKSIKFHYVEAGDKSDPLLILLHGFPDCWIGWRSQIDDLSKYFRVVAIDLKGFNDSEKPHSRSAYKPKQICEEILYFIKSLGLTSAIIIGHDLGAIIGWMFAHTYPDHIDKFISVSAPHPNLMWTSLQSKSQINDFWLKSIQLPYFGEMELSENGPQFLEKCLTHLNQDKRSVKTLYRIENHDKFHIDVYKYIFNRKSDWTGPLNYYRNFPFYKIKEGEVIQCPCLIITGNDDNICRLESIVKSTEYCSNCVLKIIAGAGHWPHQERCDEFNKIVLKFLIGSAKRKSSTEQSLEKQNKSFVERMFGAVANTRVKISGLVLDTSLTKSITDDK